MRAPLHWILLTALVIAAEGALAAPILVVENPEQFDSGFGFPPGTPDLWRAYDVYNNSDVEGPAFNIVAVVVTNSDPLTEWTRAGWIGVDVTSEEIWNQPMRGEGAEEGGDLTWSEFFGGAEFPGPANGYYLDYVREGLALVFEDNPIVPGEASLREFWFAGPLESEYLVAGASADLDLGSLPLDTLFTLTGTAAVPEPTAALTAFVGILALAARRRTRC